jgi:16S rRNA processing protein RimM
MSEFQDNADNQLVVLGKISGAYGVKGWLKIHSETDPVQNIIKYKPWLVLIDKEWKSFQPLQGKKHGKGVIVQLDGIDDRDQAAELKGCKIAITRDQLPASAGKDKYFWTDLEGLIVKTLDGFELGKVSHLFETGANDVLVIKGDRERLVPYIADQVIKQIDLENGWMIVDWDKDF